MIELPQLGYFLAAVEHGSFRKAAPSLGVQESTASRRIRALEGHVGASLFIRYNGGGGDWAIGGWVRPDRDILLVASGLQDELMWQDLANERLIVSDAAPGKEIHDYR